MTLKIRKDKRKLALFIYKKLSIKYQIKSATKHGDRAPATPATPKAVETASILPHTNANEQGSGAVLELMATIASLGLLGAISKKFKKQN
ncbi:MULTISPECIES: hypothetical protein [Leuconostoc gelidum group]|uniref:hypothetical protein n=1 Tax=Leuconostoc gelidum group TaxID=3016637 RepID=UPI0002191D8C|nr:MULTISPECIES: hypothetical protein [Leuconostoc gelidum group]GMA66427.1 hypothetical protein GCM10025884_00540 [Leuconostoc gelidum subsp. gelidum]GMA66535.1 hypothetical protein GCM10025884_01620 [Leuconostoc gelidum subsp. gelidum]GMA66571.1 hypothetical protein GCM10025884_01980 [Leuconostoc gelidum subsp. gelidum]